MKIFFVLFMTYVAARRKKLKEIQKETSDDEPVETAPEFGKVWHPTSKKWGHYIGRGPHALVAFIEKDASGAQMSAVMEQVLGMIDKSKLNLVVAENWQIPEIIEEQGITTFPSVKFYKSGNKKWSSSYEGFPSAKSIAKWVNKQVEELDEWEHDQEI
ncbi:hypothetical protein GPJ56_000652 [Histomonas meleagridis]|uniref:uncharacterized protein n=1 Tax=Histomonas meleagridis TaxID=135588 RepID=UPI00355A0FCD|nr:hypothetical protein GPJ56_000652 [Histomonas meleagridis]KAH0804781.1 hypothetical protein GO595_002475 [Histomonas meleagridis]